MSQICQPCGRRVQSVNNAVRECSLVECPHRKAQMWLDDLVPVKPERAHEPPIARVLDDPEQTGLD